MKNYLLFLIILIFMLNINILKSQNATIVDCNYFTQGQVGFYCDASMPCHMNISCPDYINNITNNIRPERNATVLISLLDEVTFEFSKTFTGVLINNPSQDGKAYILTSAHPLFDDFNDPVDLSLLSFTFNFQSFNCKSTNILLFGQSGSLFNVLGATEKVIGDPGDLFNGILTEYDYALLEISSFSYPPDEYSPCFSGWDLIPKLSQNQNYKVLGIHHPNGDLKKKSFDDDFDNSQTHDENFNNGNIWITGYAGTTRGGPTEGGSSGSGLFSNNSSNEHNLIGILRSASDPLCADPNLITVNRYIRMSTIWNGDPNEGNGIKNFIDPNNSTASLSSFCPSLTVPTCFDGIQNQNETSKDCGGPNCPVCDPVSNDPNNPPPTSCFALLDNLNQSTDCWYTNSPTILSVISNIGTNCIYETIWEGPGTFTVLPVQATNPSSVTKVINSIALDFGGTFPSQDGFFTGLYTIKIIEEGNPNHIFAQKSIQVFLSQSFPALAGADKTTCPNTVVTLGAAAPAAGVTYVWSSTNAQAQSWLSAAGFPMVNVTPTEPGTFTYRLTAYDNGCASTDEVTLTVGGCNCPNYTPVAVYLPHTQTFCATPPNNVGATLETMTVNGSSPYTFFWSPTSGLSNPTTPNPIAAPTSITTYTVRVTDAYGCTATASVIVEPLTLPNPLPASLQVCGNFNNKNQPQTHYAQFITACTTPPNKTTVQKGTLNLFATTEIRLAPGFETDFISLGVNNAGTFRASIIPCSEPPYATRLGKEIAVELEGEAEELTIEPENPALSVTTLHPNAPNPYATETEISYTLGAASPVTLTVYDLFMRPIQTLVQAPQEAGTYRVPFSAASLPAGVYYYELRAGTFRDLKQMVVAK